MREIKFRAWDEEENRWLSVEEIEKLLFLNPQVHPANRGVFHLDTLTRKSILFSGFTGLHDRNGKEIWEGDILMGKSGPKPVLWSEKEVAFVAAIDGYSYIPVDNWKNKEVIGNIYENPELLEKVT